MDHTFTDDELIKIMRECVKLGIFPRHADEKEYLDNYAKLRALLEFISGLLAQL